MSRYDSNRSRVYLTIRLIASFPHRKWLAAFLLVVAGLSLIWMGCGRKGPPLPPRRSLPPAVKDLSYAVDSRIVELTWTVPGADDRFASSPVGYKIFRSKLSAEESNCEKCPIQFTEIGDVPIQMKQSEKSKPTRMSFTEVLEPGYRYIYKVIVYDKNGMGSQGSNTVEFDH
jgi:predicted small lipoprotein YifL